MKYKIWFLFIIAFGIMACSISQAVTPTVVPTEFPTAISAVGTPTLTPIDTSFVCEVNVDALNVRSCGAYDCSSIGSWSIRGQRLVVTKVGSYGGWYFVREYEGWIKAEYCDKIK